MKTDVRFDDFIVRFSSENNELSVNFAVFPVIDWKGEGGTKGTSFTSKIDGSTLDMGKGEDHFILKKMQGSYCWRGVWESRLYFDEEEYWGEDLAELSNLFSTHIEPWCKNYIRQFYPHADE